MNFKIHKWLDTFGQTILSAISGVGRFRILAVQLAPSIPGFAFRDMPHTPSQSRMLDICGEAGVHGWVSVCVCGVGGGGG
jgi:hypothetical protein